MRKEYHKYVCNRIIFVCVIWMIILGFTCGNGLADVNMPTHGIYHTNNNDGTEKFYSNIPTTCSYQAYMTYRVEDCGGSAGNWKSSKMWSPGCGNEHKEYWVLDMDYYSSISCSGSGMTAADDVWYLYDTSGGGCGVCFSDYYRVVHVFGSEDIYTISGNTCGLGNIELYILDGATYRPINDMELTTSGDSYSFNIVNGTNYKIEFSDTHSYEFTCTDNIVYNRDLCDYQILYYVDDCANLFKNPYIDIIVNDNYADPFISGGTSNTDVLIIGTDVELNDKLDIWIDTDQGSQFRTLYASNGENTLFHSTKSWDLSVTVYDINTSAYISGAKVCVDQDCRINDYAHLSCGTTNAFGLVKTFDLSNQNYRVKVEKEGYNTFGYQTISANFDAQTTNIPLRINLQNSSLGGGNGSVGDPDGDDTGTGGDGADSLPNTTCSIGWFSNDQKSISEINDTQDARLYFMAGNCSCELILESRNTVTHLWDVESTLPLTPKQTGYVQFTSANWTYPITKRYRGHLHGFSCGCDATDTLKVWDAADPNTTTITNLSCNVRFRYAHGSYINPSTPIKIASRAASNNTTLLNINLQLFNGTVKVDEISYTFFDYYRDSQFKSINWEPNYEFASGHRYCVYMYSNDILVDFDTVYANATDGNPFDTGNTLCVHVFDQSSMPLANSYVYIDGWDVKPTGTDNKVCFSGMPPDIYNYRATKPNYQDRGLSSVTMDVDKVVNYVLDKISDVHSVSTARLTNREIKSIYLPLMYLLFIMILLGGLSYVSK